VTRGLPSTHLEESALWYVFGKRIDLIKILLSSLLAAHLRDIVVIATKFWLSVCTYRDTVSCLEILELEKQLVSPKAETR
jgi:hypothetical protein